MVQIELKGLAKSQAKGTTYYYAWRGGPRVFGEPGSPAFIKSFTDAHEALKKVDPHKFLSVIAAYRAGPFQRLAPSTKRVWAPWLDRIRDAFGDLSLRLANEPQKMRPIIRDWRNQWAKTPRAADTGLQVLSVIFSYGIEPEGDDPSVIDVNPCTNIKRLYSSDRSDIIWTDDDLEAIEPHCSWEVWWAVLLAAHTGLRQGDLVRLTWSDVKENEIVVRTGKSRGKIVAYIPLYKALRDVLKMIPKRSPVILTNTLGQPWGKDGHHLRKPFARAKAAAAKATANPELEDKHFHDLRGTAATKFYIGKIDIRIIAEIMGWSEGDVRKIIRRYVGRDAATKALIRQINRAAQ